MEAGKVLWLVAALALTGCGLPHCNAGRTVMPCSVGFYHAKWPDIGYEHHDGKLMDGDKVEAILAGSPG